MDNLTLKRKADKHKPPADTSWFRLKQASAGVIVMVMLIFTMGGANSSLDALFPGLFQRLFSYLYAVVDYLFIDSIRITAVGGMQNIHFMYQTKSFFLLLLLFIFAGIGVKHSLGRWALWICSREPEKGPLYAWIPNFLYSEYAAEKYKLANRSEEIAKLQQEMQNIEAEKRALLGYIEQLKKTITSTVRDRRMVFNLDHLIGKCHAMGMRIFREGHTNLEQLKRFLSQVCSEICSTTANSLNNKHAYIYLYNDKIAKMVLFGECRGGGGPEGEMSYAKGEGFVGKVFATGEEQMYRNIAREAPDIIVHKGQRRYNSIAGVPITFRKEVIGVVVVSSQQENEICAEDYDHITPYLNIIKLALLIEFSQDRTGGGNEYEKLARIIQQKEAQQPDEAINGRVGDAQ